MEIALYSGTFNPIHNAHLIAAQTAKEALDLDKIIFIPSSRPPHKDNGLIPAQHRFNMVKLAIEDNSSFEISDIEFKKENKCYSYLTVKELTEAFGVKKLNFIIGADAFYNLDSWFEAQKLTDITRFIVLPRDEEFSDDKVKKYIKLRNLDYIPVKMPLIDISSTMIRERVKNGISIKDLVPEKVERYIHEYRIFE